MNQTITRFFFVAHNGKSGRGKKRRFWCAGKGGGWGSLEKKKKTEKNEKMSSLFRSFFFFVVSLVGWMFFLYVCVLLLVGFVSFDPNLVLSVYATVKSGFDVGGRA